jgi:predicted nucleotidyltransferase
MGTINTSRSGLANALFTKAQQRVLGLLFGEPDREFSVSEVKRIAASGSGAVQRELLRLEASQLVTVTTVGNQKRYRANATSPLFEELRAIILKTVGLAAPLQEVLAQFANDIDLAFVYGSTTKGSDTARSDIDLMILGDRVAYSHLFPALEAAEKKLGRQVSPNMMTPTEWRLKLRKRNAFVQRVAGQPKIFVIGSQDDLDRVG